MFQGLSLGFSICLFKTHCGGAAFFVALQLLYESCLVKVSMLGNPVNPMLCWWFVGCGLSLSAVNLAIEEAEPPTDQTTNKSMQTCWNIEPFESHTVSLWSASRIYVASETLMHSCIIYIRCVSLQKTYTRYPTTLWKQQHIFLQSSRRSLVLLWNIKSCCRKIQEGSACTAHPAKKQQGSPKESNLRK